MRNTNLSNLKSLFVRPIRLLTVTLVIILHFSHYCTAANRYWVGRGTSTNWGAISSWSTTSGGAGGASVPTAADDVIFDANSFNATGQSVNVNVAANCLSMDWTGAQYTPTLTGTSNLNIYGSLVLISDMNITYTGTLSFTSSTTGNTVTTAGKLLSCPVIFGTYPTGVNGTWTLNDSISTTNYMGHYSGTLNTNNKNITAQGFSENVSASRTLNMGSSTFTITGSPTGWGGNSFWLNSAGLTLNAGTSTIKFTYAGNVSLAFNGAFTFFNVQWTNPSYTGTINNFHATNIGTFNNVSFAGNGVIFNYNNFNGTLTLSPGKIYNFSSGKIQTFGSASSIITNGNCGKKTSINSTTVGSPAIFSKSGGNFTIYNCGIKDITASGGAVFDAVRSENKGNCTGWNFIDLVTLTRTPSGPVCPGEMVTFTANLDSCHENPQYQWKKNGVIIPNANSSTFSDNNFTNGDTVNCLLNIASSLSGNLITNGNFESGNTGFFTSLTYNATNLFNSCRYSVASDPDLVNTHPDWTSMKDHTSGSGLMFIANGTDTTTCGRSVWKKTVSGLSPDIYSLNFWTADVSGWGNIIHSIYINGVQIGGNFSNIPAHNWTPISVLWNNTGATSATIEIKNGGNTVSGNDFAIDDIGFFKAREVTSPIIVTVLSPIISHPANNTTCEGGSANFNVAVTDTTVSYQWQISTDYGSSWANQGNGGVYNNMTSATMNIISATAGMNHYQYRCAISVACGSFVSNAATLTIGKTMFWIGGSGNWNDHAHWSLDSLPPRTPNPAGCIPDATTDVYFDQYSGFAINEIVHIDALAYCKSMDWSGSLNHPLLAFSDSLYIYGSLRFISDMDVDTAGVIWFRSPDADQTTSFAGAKLGYIGFRGTGSWKLLDSINCAFLDIICGSLYTNDNTINAGIIVLYADSLGSINFDLGASQLNIGSAFIFFTDSLQMDADSSTIVFTDSINQFMGWSMTGNIQDYHFNDITFQNAYLIYPSYFGSLSFNTVKFMSDGYFEGNNSFNHLHFSPGASYTFTSGNTDTIWNTWTLPSSSDNEIMLQASDSGSIATIFKPDHCVQCDWLQVYDIEVTGGATFYAGPPAHSYLRNSPGWVLDTLDSPWIGNSSDWNTSDNWDLNGDIPNINTNVRLHSCGLRDAVISQPGAYCDTLILDPGTSLTIMGSNTLDVYGDWVAHGAFYCNTSTVNFKGSSTLYGSYPLQFYNVGVDTGSSLALNTGYEIKIAGDFLNDGKFSPNEGKITFNGDGQQEIRMTGDSLYDVEFVNIGQSAGFDDFMLYDDASITHEAVLTSGVIKSSSGADFIITDGAVCNEGSELSYVDGRVIKQGNSAFTFPLGDSAVWAPAGIDAPASSSEISAQYFFALPPDTGLLHMNTGMLSISNTEWWNLESDNAYPDVTLYWKNGARSGISSTTGLEFAHLEDVSGTNKWTARTGILTGTKDNGSITSAGMTSYSPMTLGKGFINPLPVTLISFEAKCSNGMTLLNWSTATETNSDHFIVERSADMLHWTSIVKLNAAGNSNEILKYEFTDDEPADGINYYRLEQVDRDGSATIYGPVDTYCAQEMSGIKVYPNPFSRIINVEYFSTTPEELTLIVFDGTGREVYRTSTITGSQQHFTIDLDKLKSGVYCLNIKTESGNQYWKIIKE